MATFWPFDLNVKSVLGRDDFLTVNLCPNLYYTCGTIFTLQIKFKEKTTEFYQVVRSLQKLSLKKKRNTSNIKFCLNTFSATASKLYICVCYIIIVERSVNFVPNIKVPVGNMVKLFFVYSLIVL